MTQADASGRDRRYGLLQLIASDYDRYREMRGESRRSGLLKAPFRFIINSSLRALVIVRLTCCSPRWMHWFWRSVLLTLHSSEVVYGAEIGPRLWLPHPFGFGIGGLVKIGQDATICQNVTLASGMASDGQPQLGNNVVVLSGAMIAGPVTIGDNAIVGANVVLEEDLPDAGVCGPARARIVRRRRAWPGYPIIEYDKKR
jgi:serine acetyltransferase